MNRVNDQGQLPPLPDRSLLLGTQTASPRSNLTANSRTPHALSLPGTRTSIRVRAVVPFVPVPIADSAGLVTGLGIIVAIVFAVVGMIVLGIRGARKAREENAAAEAAALHNRDETAEEVEPNIGAMGLAGIAAALAVVSVFLPALESSAFSTIAKNTLIQSGGGWLILGCAVGILGAVYRVYSTRTSTWAVLVLGLVILVVAIYYGTGERTELEGVGPNPIAQEKVTVQGSPAVGIYAAGAAGLLAMLAGYMLGGGSVSSYQGANRRTKVCPDCAETVLDAARICKHCGHRFDLNPGTTT